MKTIKKYKGIIITILLTLIITLSIMFFNNTYPFTNVAISNNTIDNVFLPSIYKIKDLISNGGSFIFDFNHANASEIFYLLVSSGAISPTSFILTLVSRDYIPNMISFILVLKMLQISLITYFVLKKLLPKPKTSQVIAFTLLYTFSGFTLTNFMNINYLDIISLYPLLILGINNIIKNNKYKLFIISIILMLLINYYLSIIGIITTIILSIIYIVIFEKENKNKLIKNITINTILSFLISSIILLPIFTYIFKYNSVNMYNTKGYLEGLFIKLVPYLTLGIPISLTIKQLFNKDKKINKYILISSIIILIPLIIDYINKTNMNLLKNILSFDICYIVTFLTILCSLYYLKNIKTIKIINTTTFITSLLIIGVYIALFVLMKDEILSTDITMKIERYSQIFGFIMLFIIMLLIPNIILKNDAKTNRVFIYITIITSIITTSILIIKNNNNTIQNTLYYEYKFNKINDGYNYNNNSAFLNKNFSLITNLPTINNYNPILPYDNVEQAHSLRYGVGDSTVYAIGGTLFSDLLLHNKHFITYNKLNEEMYELIETDGKRNYYQTKYNLNHLIKFNGNIYNDNLGSTIENQNIIYKELFDQEKDIMHRVEPSSDNYKHTFKIEKGKIYYSYMYPVMYENFDVNLKKYDLNIEQMLISEDNTVISIFTTNETKDITINFKEFNLDSMELAYIDPTEFIEFYNSINIENTNFKRTNTKITYDYNSKEDTSVLIPISYNDNYKIKINNKEVDYQRNLYNMISIDIKKGNNKIEIAYKNNIYIIGLIISLISLITCIIYNKTRKDI